MPDLLDDVASQSSQQPDLLDEVAGQQSQDDQAAAAEMRSGPPAGAKGPAIPDPGMQPESVGRAVFGPAKGAVDAVKSVPGVGLLGDKPQMDDPLRGTIDTEKRGAQTFKEGLDLLGPDNFADNSPEGFKQTARGFTKLADGAMTMSAPALAAELSAPEAVLPVVKGLITGTISGVAAQKITKAAGFDQDYQDLAKTVGFFLPTAVGALTGATSSEVPFGEGKATVTDYATPKGATAPGSGRVSTFRGSNPQEFTAGARVGGKTFGIRIPRGRAAAPGAATGPDVLPPPPDPVAVQQQADAAATSGALSQDAQATEMAKQAQAGVPPPKPPMPAGMDKGELRPGVVKDAAKLIQMAPPEMRGPMMLEAHGNLTKWLAGQGKIVMPDGKIQIIDTPEKAGKVAQDMLNAEVDRHQAAHDQQKADQEQAQADQQKQEEDTIADAGKAPDGEEEENPVVARARTILAANANAPQSRQLALLQRQLRVGPGMANQLLRQALAAKAYTMAGGMVGASTEQVTPEPKEQIDAQVAALQKGTVPVVFLPDGMKYKPAVPAGMKAIKVSGADTPGSGTYIYNPTQIQAAAIKEAAKNGTHGDLLGHINAKEQIPGMKLPAVLQAKGPDGMPIQESVVDAANPDEIRDQAAALRERHPEAEIQIRHPEAALNERDHLVARSETAGGDIFDHIAQQRGKETANAVQKQGTAGVLQQPGGQGEGRGEGSQGVQPGEQRREKSARESTETEVKPSGEGGRGESPEPGERRQDTERRRRVSEMSPEEMRRELQTSDKTGLPNRRAFEDAEAEKPAKAIAMSDADGLKALNDSLGYEAGDQLLKAKGDALREAGIEAYHDKGDEFLYRDTNTQSLRTKLERAREILRGRTLEVTMKDGSVRRFQGADFSYGTGDTTDAAERGLKEHKAEREASGERRRGELRSIKEVGQEPGKERESAPERKHEFGSTQHTLEPGSEAHAAIERMQDSIPKDALAGKGKDVDEPHVTLRYGIKGKPTEDLRQYLRSQRPFIAKLGKTGSFPPTPFSDGAAVLMAPVESSDLHRMNAEVEKHAKFGESSFPEYKPHVTVAYMKPDRIAEFTGRSETEGKTFRVDSIDISDQDGEKETVKLEGGQSAIAKGDAGVRFKDDKGIERSGTVAHTNERVTRLRANDGKEYTVKTAGLKPAADIAPGAIGELHSSQIHLAPKDFQYKVSNIGSEGVSSLLEGSEWNPDLSGIVSVWRDPANGKFYAVNGHHRTQRARQTGGQTLAVRHLVAENRGEARAIGALQNIAEGRGTAVDAAKFLRDSGITLEDLEKKGISMGEATAQNGVALARLDQSLFDRVATGKLSERKGIAIGRATDNPATQEAIVKMLDKAEARGRHVTDATVQELARFAASAGEKEQTVSSLFGDRVETQNLALEKAEASAYVQKQLRLEKNLFGAVSSEARAKTLARTGNKITAAKNAAESQAAMQALEVYDRLSARRGPVDDLLNQAAKDLADGKPASRTKSELYDGIRAAVRESIGGVEGAGTRRGAPADDGPSNLAETEEEDGDGRPTAAELEAAGQNGLSFSPVFSREHGPLNPSLTPSDPFYLKSSRVVAQKMRGPMKGADLVKMLENAGVKADEIQWTGLGELKGEDKVTPDQVREVLAQDRAKLTEVVKGARFIPHGQLPEDWTISEEGNAWHVFDEDGDFVASGDTRGLAVAEARRQENRNFPADEEQDTKYEQYQLPGGANYREMLMTLPRPFDTKLDTEYADLSKEHNGITDALQGSFTDEQQSRLREIQARQREILKLQEQHERSGFQSGHWDEPNILTHIRFNDRTDAEGRKLLHLEEVQSDWHQKGRDKGYRPDAAAFALEKEKAKTQLDKAHADRRPAIDAFRETQAALDRHGDNKTRNTPKGKAAYEDHVKAKAEVAKTNDALDTAQSRMNAVLTRAGEVPDAPFKKTWHELALRRMLYHAAENGYDGMSWTPGEKQAERYDLSKQIDNLEYFPESGELSASKGRSEKLFERNVPPEKLADYVGKEAARKLLEKPLKNGRHLLAGLDLKVGGEGMKGFYDKIVPDYLNKLGKQWGAKVGETSLGDSGYHVQRSGTIRGIESWHIVDGQGNPLASDTQYTSQEYAEGALARRSKEESLSRSIGDVPYLPITDAMRKSVLGEGQPMFSPARVDATPEQQARAQRLTTSDPKFPYLDRPGIAKLYQQNLRRVVTEPETPTLPGMGEHVEEHTKSAEQVSAEALNQRGVKDITKATREIEQHSPLFGDNEEVQGQGALFGKRKPPQEGTGQRQLGEAQFRPDRNIAVGNWNEATTQDRYAWNDRVEEAMAAPLSTNLALGNARVIPAKGDVPAMLDLNPHGYALLRKMFKPEELPIDGHFAGIHMDGTWIAKMAIRMGDAMTRELNKAYDPDLAVTMLENRLPDGGGAILLTGNISAGGVREEIAHSWFDRAVRNRALRIANMLEDSEIFQRSQSILRSQGYSVESMHPGAVLNEVISKTLADAGGDLMPLKQGDVNDLLYQFLDTLRDDLGRAGVRTALQSIPLISSGAREAIGEWKASNLESDARPAFRTGETDQVAATRSTGASGPRGPPEGQDAGLFPTPQRDAAESRGRDEVARQRDLPDEGADEPMSPLENFVAALTDYIRSDSELTEGKLQRGIMRQTRGEMDRRIAQTATALEKDRFRWAGKSHDAFMKFADAVEKVGDAKVSDLDPKDQKLAQYFQDQYWKRIEMIRALKEGALQDLIENYISHNWERPGLAEKAFKQVFSGRRPFAGKASFLKQRTIPTIREGVELGLRPKTWNPVEDFLGKILEMDRFIMGHQTLMGMKQAGTAKMVRVGERAPEGWQQLDDRIGTVQSKTDDGGLVVRGHYYAPADAARPFNNFVSRGIAGRSVIYDSLRWANNNMNALQLGISFFHAMTTTNNAIASDIALGIQEMSRGQVVSGAGRLIRGATLVPSVVQTFRNGSKLMAEYLTPGSYEKFSKEAEALATAGGRAKMDVIQPKPLLQIMNHFRNGEVFRGTGKALAGIIHATTYPVLEYWVPRMKVGAFYADAHSVLGYARKKNWTPERTRMEVQKAWDSADHRFGQVVYDNLFWHKTLRDVLQLSQRAVGWNYGTAVGVGGSIPEAARAAGRVATGDMSEFGTLLGRAMSFVIGMTMATGLIGALLEYHWQGHGPRSGKDFFYPQRPDGQRVTIPGYMKDLFSFAHAPIQTVLNKLAPVFSAMADLYKNQDFYRVEIRHGDDNWLQQTGEVGKYLAQSLEAFSVRAQEKMIQNQGAGVDTGVKGMLRAILSHPEDAVLGQLGFQPAPAYVQNTPAANLAYEYSVANSPPGMRTSEQFEKSRIKRAISDMYRSGKVDRAQIREYIKSGKISAKDATSAEKNAHTDPLLLSVRHGELTLAQTLAVYEHGNASERKVLRPILARKAGKLSEETDPDRRKTMAARLRKALGSPANQAAPSSDSLWEMVSTHR